MNALKYNMIKQRQKEKERYESEKAKIDAMSEEERAEYLKQKEERHKKVKDLLSFTALVSSMVDKKY